MSVNTTIFVPILIASLLLFAYSCYRRFSLAALGAAECRTDQPLKRLAGTFLYAFAQKKVILRPYGFVHLLLFWAFMVLLLANGEFLIAGAFPKANLSLLPAPLYHGLLVAFDVVSLIALGCVLFAAARRLFFAPDYLGNDYVKANRITSYNVCYTKLLRSCPRISVIRSMRRVPGSGPPIPYSP